MNCNSRIQTVFTSELTAASKHKNYRVVNKRNRSRGQVLIPCPGWPGTGPDTSDSCGLIKVLAASGTLMLGIVRSDCLRLSVLWGLRHSTPDPASASIFWTRLRGLQCHYYSDTNAECLSAWPLISLFMHLSFLKKPCMNEHFYLSMHYVKDPNETEVSLLELLRAYERGGAARRRNAE